MPGLWPEAGFPHDLKPIGVIRLASNKGEALKSKSVTEVEFKIPVGKDGRPAVSYLRAEAYDETNERLFSQPIIFGPAATL